MTEGPTDERPVFGTKGPRGSGLRSLLRTDLRRVRVITEALPSHRTFLDADPLGCIPTDKTERETDIIRIPMSRKDMIIMKKRYLIAGAVILGLLVTPAVAFAFSQAPAPAPSPVSTPGIIPAGVGHEGMDATHDSARNGDECTDEMHASMRGADGVQSEEWMDEMHDSVWNGNDPDHDRMDEMHESMWGADGSGHGSMMGSGYGNGSTPGYGNGGGMRGGR